MGKRKSGLIGERDSVNPVLLQKKREKEMQRKRHKVGKPDYIGKGSVAGKSDDTSKDIESRAKAWKEAQLRPFGLTKTNRGPVSDITHNVAEFVGSFPAGAKYSVYYDPLTNPTGKPPMHKPIAYQHKDGVIRSFPPIESDLSSSESDSSDDSSDAAVKLVAPAVASIPVVVRPPAPIPVRSAPPPRPVCVAKKPALLPVLLPVVSDPVRVEPIHESPTSIPAAALKDAVPKCNIVIESKPMVLAKPTMFAPSSIRRK